AFVLVYKWSARVGKKKVFLIGNGIFALCLPLLVTMKHFPIFGWAINWVVMLLGGAELSFGVIVLLHTLTIFTMAVIPIATVFVLPRAIFADIVDLDAELTGYRREAMYNGMEGLLTKFAAGLATIIAPLLLKYGGDTFENPWGILLAGPVAGVLLLLGYLAFKKYPIEK
ncbi:MAG: MFS transporter, partial [Candidatus Alcyoniella australis]|nr:MFS transporter [Candidatus Alcyoniella australis]